MLVQSLASWVSRARQAIQPTVEGALSQFWWFARAGGASTVATARVNAAGVSVLRRVILGVLGAMASPVCLWFGR